MALRTFNMGQFFAQVQLDSEAMKIRTLAQLCNLDETWFIWGGGLWGWRGHGFLIASSKQAIILQTLFWYKHCIPVPIYVFSDLSYVLQKVVFWTMRELMLSNGVFSQSLSKSDLSSWKKYWCKDTQHLYDYIPSMYTIISAHGTYLKVGTEYSIVLLYDALGVHMSSEVMNHLFENKTAVIALPANIKDLIQTFVIFMFGPGDKLHW